MKNIIISHGLDQHYTINFSNGLAKNKAKISLITWDELNTQSLDPSITCYNLIGNNDYRRSFLAKLIGFALYHLKLIMFVVKNKRSNVHIIGLFRYPVLMGIIECIILRAFSKKLIITVHNLLPHDSHTFKNELIYKIIYKIPNYLIVHTEKMKNSLVNYYDVNESKVFTMHHGLNEVMQAPKNDKRECRVDLGIPEDKIVLLLFGKIAPYKGIDTFLKTFELLDENYFCVIAGKVGASYGEAYSKHIDQLVNKNKNSHRIIFKNEFIDDQLVPLYFQASDMLVLPYKNIDQSGVLLLALTMGVPIIAFNVGSFSEYISEESGVIVDEKNNAGLLKAIKKFDLSKYDKVVIKSLAKKYNWEEVTKPILFLYEAR